MLILVTGSPGVGKTTLCRKVLEQLRTHHNFSIFGFVSAERKGDKGQRIGFDLIDLQTEERARLATTETITDERIRLGIHKEEVMNVRELLADTKPGNQCHQSQQSRTKPPMVGKYRVTLAEWEPLALRSLAEFRGAVDGSQKQQNVEDTAETGRGKRKKRRWGKDKEGADAEPTDTAEQESTQQSISPPVASQLETTSNQVPETPPNGEPVETSDPAQADPASSQESGKSLLVIDEIGKMELFSQQFVQQVRGLVAGSGNTGSSSNASSVPILMTVAVKGGGFIEEVKRMPQVTKLIEVTAQNRNQLFDEILTEFVGSEAVATK